VKRRFALRLEPRRAALDELVEAIQTLLHVTSKEDPLFLAHGLKWLVGHMHADQASLVTVQGSVLATQWWTPERPDGSIPPHVPSLCQWLLDNPFRTLVLRNIPKDSRWRDEPGLQAAGARAVAGASLRDSVQVRGLVFLYYASPHAFTRAELALLSAGASYLGRILEIETLKSSLRDLENFLAITKAVVEDSSIQDRTTELPNQRYLEIWLKANLMAAAREQEAMTVAQWSLHAETPEGASRVKAVAERIRGGDLLVSMGHERYLLILQRMPKGLGQIFLSRLRPELGDLPMGATVWMPGLDDLRLESVLRRVDQALEESCSLPGHDLVWRLPET
jgi:hypothetical protein